MNITVVRWNNVCAQREALSRKMSGLSKTRNVPVTRKQTAGHEGWGLHILVEWGGDCGLAVSRVYRCGASEAANTCCQCAFRASCKLAVITSILWRVPVLKAEIIYWNTIIAGTFLILWRSCRRPGVRGFISAQVNRMFLTGRGSFR